MEEKNNDQAAGQDDQQQNTPQQPQKEYAKPKRLGFFNLLLDDIVFMGRSFAYNITHVKRWKMFNFGEYLIWQRTKRNLRKRFHQLQEDHDILQEMRDYSIDDLIWIHPEFNSRINKYIRLSDAYVKEGSTDKGLESLLMKEFFKIKSMVNFAKSCVDVNHYMIRDKYGIPDFNIEFSDAYKYELEKKAIYNDEHDHKLDPELRHRSLMNKARIIVKNGLKFYNRIKEDYKMPISNDINDIDSLATYLHSIHVKYSWPKVTAAVALGIYLLWPTVVGISYFQLNSTIRNAREKIPQLKTQIDEQRKKIEDIRQNIAYSTNKEMIRSWRTQTNKIVNSERYKSMFREIGALYDEMSQTNDPAIIKARDFARSIGIKPECYCEENTTEKTQDTQKVYK